jgi:hypothetical protein
MSIANVDKKFYFNKVLLNIGFGLVIVIPIGLIFLWKYSVRNKKTKENENKIIDSMEVTDTMSKTNITIKTTLNELKVIKIVTKECENVLNNIVMALDIIREDYDMAQSKFKSSELKIKDFSIENFKKGSK